MFKQLSLSFPKKVSTYGYLALWLIGIIGLGFFVEQSSFELILLFFSLSFFGYWRLAVNAKLSSLSFLLVTAVLARLVLVFAFPSLSDDIYRFIWDGRLILAGQNPFDHLPSWYMAEGKGLVSNLDQALFEQLNSPDYYTIYPPIAQAIHALACFLSPNSWWGAAVIIKLSLLFAEIGSIYLLVIFLQHWQLPLINVLWYALNPLIIVEIVGNLHFEGMMIFFLLLAVWLLVAQKELLSAVAMAFSVASKLLPLLLFPFMVKRIGWLKSVCFFCLVFIILGLLWWPFLNTQFIQNFSQSLDLYFQQFEFNGSVYYFFRWWGYQTEGHNLIKIIGPNLAKVVFVMVVVAALFDKKKDWKSFMMRGLFAFMIYLFLATTVHPWYSTLPLVFCVFTTWRFPVLWTYLITWTYINYSYSAYYENLAIVLAEYSLLVGFMLFEWYKYRISKAGV